MGARELETVVRLGLPMVVVVYNDDAYGAEVHHFGPHGAPLDTVRFPDDRPRRDRPRLRLRGGHRPRSRGPGGGGRLDRGPARRAAARSTPRSTRDQPSWWLEEAFRGH